MQFKLLTLAALAAGASAQMMNLTALLSSTPQLSNLTTYVSFYPAVLDALSAAKNITILAPSNEAFSKLMASPAGAAIQANDTALIQAVLTYHVLNGTYPASEVTAMPAFIPTLLMNMNYTNVTGGQVVEAVKMGSNVTFISGLLMNSTVTKADNNFTGGIVHIVDNVLTLPLNISTTAVAANLTSLTGALTDAKLVGAVDGLKDVTVFAPNNEAFQSIGSVLPNMTMEQLTQILEYHVINGTVGYSSKVMNESVMTLGGKNLTIEIIGSDVFVNSAKVVVPNVLVANGVVHVIDNVLNPNNTSAKPNPTAKTQMPAFSGASMASAVPFTSGIMAPSSAAGGSATGTAASGGSGGAASSSKSGLAAPMKTGAIGAAALFGAGAALINA